MKNFIYSILTLCLIASCSKSPDPSVEVISGYTVYSYGSGQKAFAGQFLEDSIAIQISGQSSLMAGIRVEFSVLSGGGELTTPVTIPDQSGMAYTHWKTGFISNQQAVKASIFDVNGNFLSSTSFTAYAFRPNTWDTIAEQPDAYIWDLAADTINNMTFMTSSNQLYRQADTYFNWERVKLDQFNGITNVEIDSRSFVYISNSTGDVYISKNKGDNWSKCARPFPDNSYIYLCVSNNDWVWVSTADRKLVCSKDEGLTWRDASAGLSYGDDLGEISQHPDGTLFFRSRADRLYKSVDEGKSWTRVPIQQNNIQYNANASFMAKNGDLLVYSLYYDHRILKSTDKGEHFTEIYSARSNMAISENNFFNYYKGTYYMLIPGKGIVRTQDLVHFEDYWNTTELWNLFVDHNGVLMARGSNRLFYRNNS